MSMVVVVSRATALSGIRIAGTISYSAQVLSGLQFRYLMPAVLMMLFLLSNQPLASAAQLQAGVAKVDITADEAGPVNDRLYAKALVIRDGQTTAVIVTVDAVAIGEIGYIGNEYLGDVRAQLQKDYGIDPASVMINASHCHGVVCRDVGPRTIQAVASALKAMVPVQAGTGVGHENRIMENRRLRLKNGKEADVRHAYSLPADEQVAGIGPTDPEIGILRLDRMDGQTLAIVYNFACHPIQGVPSKGNTADLTGFASRVVEEAFGPESMAFFVQGCAGDINPTQYKDVSSPRDAETHGNLLGLSTMSAAKKIRCGTDSRFKQVREILELPRADLEDRIASLQNEQLILLQSLRGTSLNLKTFMPLAVQYNLSAEFPSYYSHRYMHDKMIGRDDLLKLDTENRQNLESYKQNIYIMEELSRMNVNLALLKKHQAQNIAAGKRTVDVEVCGLRIGEFVLITFPGELTVQIGLNIKKASPHESTFVAGYTNGYIYYSPTAEQLQNLGGAQEDSDCILAPEWQAIFEAKVTEMLRSL